MKGAAPRCQASAPKEPEDELTYREAVIVLVGVACGLPFLTALLLIQHG